ncbi:MAG: ATP synthase subunit I [Lachnospiraceae bacterium]|nr:ATP synthase subunit I [Lachnospiraceae bacterium]
MSLKASLRKRNRTLLELETGIAVLGIIGLIVTGCISFFSGWNVPWTCFSWAFGVVTACVSALDMYNVLDKALDLPEKEARRRIYFGYLKRYVILGVLLAIFCISDKLNPIAFFIAYMCLKLSAYLQPFMHKAYNSYFGEKDPEPISQEEYDALHPELVPENEKGKKQETEV